MTLTSSGRLVPAGYGDREGGSLFPPAQIVGLPLSASEAQMHANPLAAPSTAVTFVSNQNSNDVALATVSHKDLFERRLKADQDLERAGIHQRIFWIIWVAPFAIFAGIVCAVVAAYCYDASKKYGTTGSSDLKRDNNVELVARSWISGHCPADGECCDKMKDFANLGDVGTITFHQRPQCASKSDFGTWDRKAISNYDSQYNASVAMVVCFGIAFLSLAVAIIAFVSAPTGEHVDLGVHGDEYEIWKQMKLNR